MNNYIGTVKEGYMFTNKLSGISKDDIIYNYDKLGKSIGFKYWIQDNYGNDFGYIKSLDYDTGYFNYTDDIDEAMIIPSYVWLKKQKWNIPDFDREHWGEEIYQGTGKVSAKYRVVGAYNKIEIVSDYANLVGEDSFLKENTIHMINKRNATNYTNHKYAIKCSLIEEVNMRLSSFVSWNKMNNAYDKRMEVYDGLRKNVPISREDWHKNIQIIDVRTVDNCKLTRYNGLTRCIKIGDEK